MKKKSPKLMGGFQKRYFLFTFIANITKIRYLCIRNDGTKLIYYKSKPVILYFYT